MRRALVLMLLLGGMQLLLPLGSAGQGSMPLLAFGFLILGAYTVGEIARDLDLPKIVGYLIAGLLFGPFMLNAVPADAVARLTPVSNLAIALIAFLAGAELRWAEVRERGAKLSILMLTEMAVTFGVIFAAVFFTAGLLPFLGNFGNVEKIVFALLVASVATVHSPAATMAVLSESGARGPLARSTLGVVLISDVAVVIFFSIVVAICAFLLPVAEGAGRPSFASTAWEIAGALLVGGLLGGAISLYIRFVRGERLLFGILIVFFGAEIARLTHVETLLALLTTGFVVENTSPRGEGEQLRKALERSAAPVFVVFFAVAGAKIDLGALYQSFLFLVPLAALRVAAIYGGTRLGARLARIDGPERGRIWMGLVSQAGVAIGLATIVAGLYPELGGGVRTILLAMISINELVGPALFRRALAKSGELDSTAADGRTSVPRYAAH